MKREILGILIYSLPPSWTMYKNFATLQPFFKKIELSVFFIFIFKKSLDLHHFFPTISQHCCQISHPKEKAACNQPLVEP